MEFLFEPNPRREIFRQSKIYIYSDLLFLITMVYLTPFLGIFDDNIWVRIYAEVYL
jgi:hypothetical protein